MKTESRTVGSIELKITQRPAFDELPLVAQLAPVFEQYTTAMHSQEAVTIGQLFARMAGSIPPNEWKEVVCSLLCTTVALVPAEGGRQLIDLSSGPMEISRAFGADMGLLLMACKAAIEVRLGNFTLGGLFGSGTEPEIQEEEAAAAAESPSTSP